MKREDYRYAFYSDSDLVWLKGVTKQLHAFWSINDSIAVFYIWGFVKEYEIYRMLQPNINEKLKAYADDMIVVVVTSIMRMTPSLLACLEKRRNIIWKERESCK
jgi:hypothetical protein